jgi:hypothetical protein
MTALSISKRASDLVVTLRRLPLFTDLSEDELELIAERTTCREYGSGSVIFLEGEPCRELLIVREGSVKLLKTAPSGRQQLLAIERTGNSLSEVPVFDGGTYPATAKSVGAATLLCLDAEHFRKICLRASGGRAQSHQSVRPPFATDGNAGGRPFIFHGPRPSCCPPDSTGGGKRSADFWWHRISAE